MELNQQLEALQTELKGYVEKANAEKTQHGTMLTETKTLIEALQKQVDAIDVKLAEKHLGASKQVSLVDSLKENEDVSRLLKNRSGRATITIDAKSMPTLFSRKTTITDTGVGFQTTGVLGIERITGVSAEGRQELRLRDLLTARPTQAALIDFVKVVTPFSVGAAVVEGSAKPENAVTFAAASEKVRTIATWVPATKQIMDDYGELGGFIESSLPYYVDLAEEQEMLSGDGTGEHLHGFITQATAYDTYANVLNDTKMDQVGHAISQIAVAKELNPTFIVLNTADWWKIRLTKDNYGRYILGDPQTVVAPSLWGLAVVATTSMTAGTFLVGSGVPPAAEIRDRMAMTVEISTEHSDFFTKNLVAVRAEKRLALIVKRPKSYVTGTFV